MTNEDLFKGKWKEISGKVKAQWGKLTDDDLDEIAGKSEQLEGKLQERYGMAKEEAQEKVREFRDSL